MSFGPFLGGKRICLGKTFVEVAAKVVGANLLYHFDFKFQDEMNLNKKEPINIVQLRQPVVMVNATEFKPLD
jgi:cytochrome P450